MALVGMLRAGDTWTGRRPRARSLPVHTAVRCRAAAIRAGAAVILAVWPAGCGDAASTARPSPGGGLAGTSGTQSGPLAAGSGGFAAGGSVCPAGKADCDRVSLNGCEIDLLADPGHCGECGAACDPGEGCDNGHCVGRPQVCQPGHADCDGDRSNGCEADLANSNEHCGQCDLACPPDHGCRAGVCMFQAPVCAPGWADCDGSRANGCEADTQNDARHCGRCQQACAPGQQCSAGLCVLQPLSCPPGWADCDGDRNNQCETNIQSDTRHCGNCGTVCLAGQLCSTGRCTAQPILCTDGYANCDGNPANHCEVALARDPAHCGSCGIPCAPDALCYDGSCLPVMCPPGLANCDGDRICEANVWMDPAHCGGCGTVCAPSQRCQMGTCTDNPLVCEANTANCDLVWANGCETDLANNPEHCGACMRQCGATPPGIAICDRGRCGLELTLALADAFVQESQPGSAQGLAPAIEVRSTPANRRVGLLMPVDLARIPPGSEILSATIELYCFDTGSTVRAHPLTAPWQEASVTWASQPSYEPTAIAGFVPRIGLNHFGGPGLLDLVRDWMSSPSSAHGVALVADASNNSRYRSTQYSNANRRPRLIVEFVPP
ncbi:MAG: DNRLRE domain-containing protein [Proteobacteria bacterium]|nr:DNRLRE domain-containing protein [Pseudomonadota bacterium]